MKKFSPIIIILVLLASSCQSNSVRETENEMFVINELILLRTEGMALCEIASAGDASPEIRAACAELQQYYTATQQEFVSLCRGRSIAIDSEDFELIWRQVENALSRDSSQFEMVFIALSSDNIMRSIALHELILQRQDWEDITYYAFKSLPKLYEQQGAVSVLQESRHPDKFPEAAAVKTAKLVY